MSFSLLDIAELAETDPATAETVTRALRSTIDFYKTRGKLLRSLQPTAPTTEDSR